MMNNNRPLEYGRIKVNTKTLDDAILNLGSIKKTTKGQISKESIYQALLKILEVFQKMLSFWN